MKARFLFWTGTRAAEVPLIEVLSFNEYSEEIFEEFHDMFKSAVGEGLAEVLDNLEIS